MLASSLLFFRFHITHSHTQISVFNSTHPNLSEFTSSFFPSYRRYNQDVSNKTHCDCKPPHPIPIQTAWTTDNPGDLKLPSDYYKGLVYSLHEENKALKRMNMMPVGGVWRAQLGVDLLKALKSRALQPRIDKMNGYQSKTDEYYVDYDYWNTWVQDEIYDEFLAETDEEDEDEVMTTKDDDLLFYQDTFPVDKFVPYGKAIGSKRIEKNPTIPGAVLGLCNTLTWVKIEKKLRKKPPMKQLSCCCRYDDPRDVVQVVIL
ncbi:hypothetical protein Tco_0897060 [Tanacetum coccineum]